MGLIDFLKSKFNLSFPKAGGGGGGGRLDINNGEQEYDSNKQQHNNMNAEEVQDMLNKQGMISYWMFLDI